MKKCPFCQQESPDRITKCPYCGEWLDTVSPPKQGTVVKPPKKGQSGTDSIDWQKNLEEILNKYRTHVISIIIIAGLLFTISQMVNFNKRAGKVTAIEPPKVEAPAAQTPEPAQTLEPAPTSVPPPVPISVINLYNNAFALCSSGKCTDPQKAIEYLNEAIKLKPDYAEAYNNRGNAYGDLGRYQQAITDYNEAISLKPDYTHAYNNRGANYNSLGQYQRAIEDFNEAIRLKPDYAIAYSNRGNAYLNQGDKISGCNDLSKACNLGECRLYEAKKQKGDCM